MAMTTDYEARISKLKADLEKAKHLRVSAEADMRHYCAQREELLREAKDLGIEPENINAELERLTHEIEKLLSEAESLLPKDLLEQ